MVAGWQGKYLTTGLFGRDGICHAPAGGFGQLLAGLGWILGRRI